MGRRHRHQCPARPDQRHRDFHGQRPSPDLVSRVALGWIRRRLGGQCRIWRDQSASGVEQFAVRRRRGLAVSRPRAGQRWVPANPATAGRPHGLHRSRCDAARECRGRGAVESPVVAERDECAECDEYDAVHSEHPVCQRRQLSVVRQQFHRHGDQSACAGECHQQQHADLPHASCGRRDELSGVESLPGRVHHFGQRPVALPMVLGRRPTRILSPVSGATNDTLVLDPALAMQSGYYYLAISNGFIQPNQTYS